MSIRNPVLALLLSGAVFCGLTTGCAASPDDVCAHIKKLVNKEMKVKGSDKMMKRCVKRYKRKKEMKGYFKYRKISRCIVAADTLKKASKCD